VVRSECRGLPPAGRPPQHPCAARSAAAGPMTVRNQGPPSPRRRAAAAASHASRPGRARQDSGRITSPGGGIVAAAARRRWADVEGEDAAPRPGPREEGDTLSLPSAAKGTIDGKGREIERVQARGGGLEPDLDAKSQGISRRTTLKRPHLPPRIVPSGHDAAGVDERLNQRGGLRAKRGPLWRARLEIPRGSRSSVAGLWP
jgi:hypothetical protein